MEEENILPEGATSFTPLNLDIDAQLFPDESDDDEKDKNLSKEVNVFGTGNIAIDEILFPVNPSLATIVAGDDVQATDEEGNVMLGATGDLEDDGQDARNLQLSMQTKKSLATQDDAYIKQRTQKFEDVQNAINEIETEVKVYDYKMTLKNQKMQVPVTASNFNEIYQALDAYEEASIAETGVGLGMYSTQNTEETENLLMQMSNNAGILDFNSASTLNVMGDYNIATDGYFNPDGKIPEINWNPTDKELTVARETKYNWDNLKDLSPEDIDKIKLDPAFEAYAISKMLEGQGEGANMRDVFQQEGMDDYATFMTWASESFKRIKLADPTLAGWRKVIQSKVDQEWYGGKRLEFEKQFIEPCAKENDGVATEDCLLRHQEAASAWWNARYNKLYNENEYIQANDRQYAIGFSKLMNKLREPYFRTKIDVYRELDNQFEQDGMTFTNFAKDAMAKVGFSMDQTKGLISMMYTNSGVTGTTARNELIQNYNSPGFQDFAEESGIYDQAIKTFRGGGGAETGFGEGGYLQGNLLNLSNTFNIVGNKITKSTLGTPEQGDFYYANKVPGGVEYVLHGGSGNLADREGTIKLDKDNFLEYFDLPEDFNVRDLNKVGARAAWEMVKQHGQAYYSPIKVQEFSQAKKVINGIDKWVVAGKAKNWFNQSAVARMYGGTGWRYGDMTIRDVFEGRDATEEEQMVSSVLDYDIEQTGVLLNKTAEMLEAEQAAQFALDPDVEFDDLTSLIRHIIGQGDTMVPMYLGGILQGTGKVVSKVPGYGKAVGYTMEGSGKVLSILGSLNMMGKEYTQNVVEAWRQIIMANNGGKPPTVEEFAAMASDPASDEIILKSMGGAVISGLSEKAGVSSTMLGFKPGAKQLASLYRKQFAEFFKQTPKWVLTTALGAGGEGITEAFQGKIHETTVNWSLGMGLGESWNNSNWDEDGFQVGWRIGLALPVAQSTVSQSLVEINQVGMEVASKLIMDPSKSNSIFAPMAAANNFFKEAIADVQKRIDNNNIPKEQGLNAIADLSSLRTNGMKIPTTMPVEQRKEFLELLLAQSNLKQKIKETNNKEISEGNGDLAALDLVNAEIVSLTEQEVTRELYMKNMGNVQNIVDQTSKGKVKIFREKNTESINSRIEELNNSGWKIKKQSKSNAGYGSIYQKGDQQIILLNEQEILSDGKVNTGAHEFLHAVIYQTVKNSKGTAIELGNNLLEYIKKINPEALKKGEFKERYEQYKNAEDVTDAVMGEEILTLFSEAVLDGAIELDTSMREQIGDFFTRIIDTLMGRKRSIRFDTGKDVYKFIKDYNKSIEKGKFTEAQQELLEKSAEGDLVKRKYKVTKKEQEDIEKSSKRLTDLVTEYQQGDTTFTQLEDQYLKVGKAAVKRWVAGQPNMTLDFENANTNKKVDELLRAQFPSFEKNFDANKSEATTYMNNIGKRVGIEIAKEGARQSQQVSTDVLTEKGFSPETTTQPDLDAKTKPTGKRAKVFPNKIKTIADRITGETRADQIVMLKKDIVEGIFRAGSKPKDIAKQIAAKTKTKEYRALIKDRLGAFGTQQYIDNVNALFANKDFISSIPVANIKRRFGKLFGIKKTGTIPTVKIEEGKETRYDKGVYSIPAITDGKLARIKNYFLSESLGEKRSQSLFSMIGEGLAVEAMQELSTDPDFMKDLQDRLNFKKSNLTAEQFMSELDFDLDKRNLEDKSLDEVKASKKLPIASYQKTAYKTAARQTMRQVAGQNSVFNYQNIQPNQESTRRTGSIIMINGLGLDTQGSYNYGKKESIYKDQAEFEQDVFNKPLTEAEITLLEKFDIPLVERKGKTYYDKSKAKNSFELGVDKQIMVKGKPKSVLLLARTEQKAYKKLNEAQAKAQLNSKEFDALQKAKLKVLYNIAKKIESDLKIDPSLKNYWAAWLNQSNDNVLHPVRSLAPVEFFETRKGNKVAEHTLPASQVATMIMRMAVDNKVDKDFDFIKRDYFQGSILKTDDVKLVGKGYNYISNMPDIFFDIKNPSTWMRYVDPKVNNNRKGPININNIIVKKNGKIVTLAESFGLKLDTRNQTPDNINNQNNLLFKIFTKELTKQEAAKLLKSPEKVNNLSSKKVNTNKEKLFGLIIENSTTERSIIDMSNADKAARIARDINSPTKGISVFDFDDTLAYSNSKVIVTMPDGKTRKITPAEFALQSENLIEQGADFNFSEFNKVVEGRKGPLADLALKRQEKFGSGDIFVLTARPQVSAVSIKTFLDGIGLNIPLDNITGLENGSPDAKALWVLNKAAEGYNDFYFADDALPNVQAVKNILDQVDVKSDIQQAKQSKKVNLDKEFNTIIEQQSGKDWYKTYSTARAKTTGRKVGRFEFFIPPSAEDFAGLLYKMLPKGEKGNLAKKWFKDNLFDPFNKAEQELISAKISVAQDFQSLRKNIDNIPKNLNKPVGVGDFTHSQALRVYIWNMQGMDIPGLSQRDLNKLVEKIENNPDLKVFAEKIAFIQKGKEYPKPGDNWVAGNITTDIIQSLNKAGRKEFLQEWQQNVDIIFSDKNLNKLEALYGSGYIAALKNILSRMKSGSNRPVGANAQVNALMDWLNNSVGAVMFLNMRSATLQLISSVNFMNWSDNNPAAAAKAFANQKQYWSDVMTLLNSDYLVQRRNGLKINVAESEIAEAARKGGMRGTIAFLLNKGFVLTRFADSMAIATGGATFYRNRVNKLLKQVNIDTGKLYTLKEAEAKAFDDFYQISEESQQSSRTDRISMQQASGIGRLILNFANTPMQYARIMKKSALDLAAGRGDWRSNLSKIVYYGVAQNLIFNAMQQAIFALAFGSDDEEQRTGAERAGNIANGMVSSLLRGLGYGGAAVDTVKDVILALVEQGAKKSPKYEEAVFELFNFSPAIDAKVRKIRSSLKSFSWNMDEMKRRGFSIENPAYLAVAQIVSATTNIPLDRAARITMNMRQALDRETEVWQKVALMFGYSGWELGLPYWGLQTTIDNEENETEAIKVKYKEQASQLKTKGYKRRPMTKGVPDGKLNVDYIEVIRPTGDTEYWLIPKE